MLNIYAYRTCHARWKKHLHNAVILFLDYRDVTPLHNPFAQGMGLPEFPSPQIFTSEKYGEFVDLLKEVVEICGLKNLSHADHFCNYVYWVIKNHEEPK